MKETALPQAIELSGSRLTKIQRESTAANLGLREGDLLVSLNSRMTSTPADVLTALERVSPNQVIRAHWVRGSKLMYADTRAMPIRVDGRVAQGPALGAQLGQAARVNVSALVGEELSGFQRGVMDWSGQASDAKKIGFWGGLAAGVLGGAVLCTVAGRMMGPAAPRVKRITA